MPYFFIELIRHNPDAELFFYFQNQQQKIDGIQLKPRVQQRRLIVEVFHRVRELWESFDQNFLELFFYFIDRNHAVSVGGAVIKLELL